MFQPRKKKKEEDLTANEARLARFRFLFLAGRSILGLYSSLLFLSLSHSLTLSFSLKDSSRNGGLGGPTGIFFFTAWRPKWPFQFPCFSPFWPQWNRDTWQSTAPFLQASDQKKWAAKPRRTANVPLCKNLHAQPFCFLCLFSVLSQATRVGCYLCVCVCLKNGQGMGWEKNGLNLGLIVIWDHLAKLFVLV